MSRIPPPARRPRRLAATAAAALGLATTLAAALPGAAAAHVTVVPKAAAAGAYQVFDVRVPNERDDKPTTSVDLQLPPGFVSASFEPVPGWQVRVVRERLPTPIETENGPISEQISRIVWSGGEIPPGAFQDFPISVQVPDRVGETLQFKALQTYAGGEVVRWIGAADSDTPAAEVAVTAPVDEGEGAGAGHSGEEIPEVDPGANDPALGVSTPDIVTAPADDDSASKGLAYAGLGAGIVGLLLGGAALTLALRRKAPGA